MTSIHNPFDQQAIAYDAWFDSTEGAELFTIELDCLQKEMGKLTGQWVEIGVGSGRFADALGVKTGVDPSPKMVKLAQARGIECCVGYAETLPFDNAIFDGVMLVFALCFIRDPLKAMVECSRVLKMGGKLVIGFIPADSPWGMVHQIKGKMGHVFYSAATFYTQVEVIALASNAGFHLQSEHPTLLPKPAELDEMIMAGTLPQRQESFAVLSFKKR